MLSARQLTTPPHCFPAITSYADNVQRDKLKRRSEAWLDQIKQIALNKNKQRATAALPPASGTAAEAVCQGANGHSPEGLAVLAAAHALEPEPARDASPRSLVASPASMMHHLVATRAQAPGVADDSRGNRLGNDGPFRDMDDGNREEAWSTAPCLGEIFAPGREQADGQRVVEAKTSHHGSQHDGGRHQLAAAVEVGCSHIAVEDIDLGKPSSGMHTVSGPSLGDLFGRDNGEEARRPR